MDVTPNCELFLLQVKVRPSPVHPTYYEWQHGILFIWMTGKSFEEDVEPRAVAILEALPYELIAEWVSPMAVDAPVPDAATAEERRAEAMKFGLSMALGMMELGEDEEWFEKAGE